MLNLVLSQDAHKCPALILSTINPFNLLKSQQGSIQLPLSIQKNGPQFLRALGGSGMSTYLEYSEFVIELGVATFLFLFSRFDRKS